MENNRRRLFLKHLTAGMLGSIALPTLLNAQIDNHSTEDPDNYWESVKEKFPFDPGLKYFNNASLGGSPTLVRKATNHYRDTLDNFPSRYMWGGWKEEIEDTRSKIGDLFSVSPEEIAIIHNTTEGMNLVARSFELSEGDEVILADHEHTSGTIPWKVWQEEKGIKLVRPTLPILLETVEDIVSVYEKAITENTRFISMCHMVNTNGMILPVKEVSEMAKAYGVKVVVDGAQTAGMIKIDLHDLGCDYYTASAHKWLFSPKGVGILYAKKESQSDLKPLVVCRGYDDESIRRLENYNTRNLPEVLGLGSAIDFHNKIGSERIHKRTLELKNYFRSKFNSNPKFRLKTPKSDLLSAGIQTVEVVGKDVKEIKEKLFRDFGIDCRPMSTHGLNALRISLAVYITTQDIDYLAEALESLA